MKARVPTKRQLAQVERLAAILEQLDPEPLAKIQILVQAMVVGTADETARLTDAMQQCSGTDLTRALGIADEILTDHGDPDPLFPGPDD